MYELDFYIFWNIITIINVSSFGIFEIHIIKYSNL